MKIVAKETGIPKRTYHKSIILHKSNMKPVLTSEKKTEQVEFSNIFIRGVPKPV